MQSLARRRKREFVIGKKKIKISSGYDLRAIYYFNATTTTKKKRENDIIRFIGINQAKHDVLIDKPLFFSVCNLLSVYIIILLLLYFQTQGLRVLSM